MCRIRWPFSNEGCTQKSMVEATEREFYSIKLVCLYSTKAILIYSTKRVRMQYEISILSNLANIALINFCQLPTIFLHLLTMDEKLKVCKTFDKVWCKGTTFKSKHNDISNELIKV